MNGISRRVALLGLGILAAPRLASAQARWPDRPIRMVVPWPPGGPVDLSARPIAQQLTELLRQPVVVENRAGAGGTIGASYVSNAAPDGYTLLFVTPGSISIYQLAAGQKDYDPTKAYAPITQVLSSPSVLVVRHGLANDLAGLIAAAKAKPGTLTYGSAGAASINHLSAAVFAARAGLSMLHVPYQGAAPLLNDLLAGRIDMAFLGIGVSLPLIRDGKVTPIVVGNLKRATALPDVPALAETYPGFQSDNWSGVLGPPGMSVDLIQLLHDRIVQAVDSGLVQRVLKDAGTEPTTSASPEAFREFLREDFARWGEAVRAAGLRPE